MKVSFCLLLCLTVAGSKLRCQTPPTWEAQYRGKSFVDEEGHMYYDATNQVRVRMITSAEDRFYLPSGPDRKIQYVIDLKTRSCDTYKSYGPVSRIEIHEDANYTGNYFIGSSTVLGGGLEVQTWNFFHGLEKYTFTEKGCLPISIRPGWDYYNISLGIDNPDEIFKVPSECPKDGKFLRDFGYDKRPSRESRRRRYKRLERVQTRRHSRQKTWYTRRYDQNW